VQHLWVKGRPCRWGACHTPPASTFGRNAIGDIIKQYNIDGVCKADVLFLDDLFKAKITEAQEQAIYGVFERHAADHAARIAGRSSLFENVLKCYVSTHL